MSTLKPRTPRAFVPLLKPARYKGAWGGRGSGKSHFFAELLIARCVSAKTDAVCVREIQKSLKQSVKKLIVGKIEALGVSDQFEVLDAEIKAPHGGVIAFQGMQDHTAETIKSLEDFDIAWVEEAQTLSQTSLTMLRPTIRKPGSELWFGWNPRRKTDPVDVLLRGPTPPSNSVVIKANWSANPWFPPELETERLDDQRDRPDQYDHVWEGDYVKVYEGAYFASQITQARKEGRIGHVASDPLMRLRTFWDLGQTDSTAIWVAQFVGQKINVLDYHEAQGQPLAYYAEWLRSNGYGTALCVLPHDASHPDTIFSTKYEDALRGAGFEVQTVKNQGRGAAMQRVEAVRRLFPRVWLDDTKCEPGLEALAAYHERRDDKRNVGLGPEHDWASHGSDAFGLMCVAYEEPRIQREERRKPRPGGANSWMGR